MAPSLSKSEIDSQPDVAKILTKRHVILNEINSITFQISKLDVDNPRVRRFHLMEEELSNKIKELRKTNSVLLSYYISNDLKITDENIQVDQKGLDTAIAQAYSVSDNYQAIVDADEDEHPREPPSATMEGILTSLVTSNKKMADNYAKKKAPDVTPPSFSPSETTKDYFLFKTFWEQFTLYVKDVASDGEKLQFLKGCVKGIAFQKISVFSIEDGNYPLAVARLKKDYLNPDKIRTDIFNRILRFSTPQSDPKFEITLRHLVHVESELQELESSQGIDSSNNQFMAHVIQSSLLPSLKEEIIRYLNKSTLTLRDIFDNSLHCSRRLLMFKEGNFSKPQNTNKNNNNATSTNKTSTVASVSCDQTSKPSNSGSANRGSGRGNTRGRGRNRGQARGRGGGRGRQNFVNSSFDASDKPQASHKCVFCGATDHMSSLCSTHFTLAARIQAFTDLYGAAPCKKCLYAVHSGPCMQCREKTCNSRNQHGTSACPIRIGRSSPNSVNSMFNTPVKSRAVALQTLILQAQPNSTLPEFEKNVQLFLDIGHREA